MRDKLDWNLTVSIALVYKDGLDRELNGQHVEFNMGAGTRPGIISRKRAALTLCGFAGSARNIASNQACDPEKSDDCIVDVPALKALDEGRPPAVVENTRTPPPAACFGYGFDPPAFWACASTMTACKKERKKVQRKAHEDYQVRTDCEMAQTLYCFKAEVGRTVCAPDADECVASRKEWTTNATASVCEPASSEMLEASTQPDD